MSLKSYHPRSSTDEILRVEALRRRVDDLKRYRQPVSWSWRQGPGALRGVTLPVGWDGTDLHVHFEADYLVPERVHGIDVQGSRIVLYSHFTTVTTTILVDGVLRFREQYWTDFRLPEVVVTSTAVPGAVHPIELECEPFVGSAGMVPLDFMIAGVESCIASLETLLEAIHSVCSFDPNAAGEALRELEISAWIWPDLNEASERARARLLPFSGALKQRQVYAIGQCHIDLNFLWPMAETVRTIESSYTAICDMLEEFPQLVFTHTQAATYEILEQHNPSLLARIEERVRAGQWEVLAATWTESDTNLPSGESLIRQFLFGQSYCEQRFGTQSNICWYPDAFGHSFNLPQILRGAGISRYFFWRAGDQSQPLFRWRGLDGTEVTAFNCDYYLRQVSAPRVGKFSRLLAERFSISESPYVFGVGNHGGGPSRADIERLQQLNADPLMPTIQFSSAVRYFDQAEQHAETLPVIARELNFVFDAAYSSHADMKWHNRRCESLLFASEVLCALTLAPIPYPQAALAQAWKHKLFNDFHDFLGGTSIREAYDYGLERARQVEATALALVQQRLARFVPAPPTENGRQVAVFNPLPWLRTAIATVTDCEPGFLAARDAVGNFYPVQYLDATTLIFTARNLAPTGVTLFCLQRELPEDAETKQTFIPPQLDASTRTLENDYLRLTLLADGSIQTLFDKHAGRAILHTQDSLDIPVCFSDYAEVTRPYVNNALVVEHELPVEGSAWFLGRVSGRTALHLPVSFTFESGPVMASAHITYRYKESELRQSLRLYAGVPWVEVHWDIDWREQGNRDTGTDILRCAFTPLVPHGRAHFEIPCGSIAREADGREVPTQRWFDLSNEACGFAVLNNAKYGCSVAGRSMSLTLIRSAYWPDAESDVGRHQFAYGLYPHAGSFEDSDVVRRGIEFNQPLHVSMHCVSPGEDLLQPSILVSVDVQPENVVVSCLKRAHASEALLLRLYEAHGKPTQANIRITPAPLSVVPVTLLEKELTHTASAVKLEADTVTVWLRPYEILTLKIEAEP